MEQKFFDSIIIFTDGSCLNIGKKNAKAGIGIHFPNKEFSDISEPFLETPITNQRAELFAIYKALTQVTNNIKFNKIIIYSDSIYSIKSLTEWIKIWERNNWKNSKKKQVKNLDIISSIKIILDQHCDKIFFKHVKAHTGKKDYESICNEIADKLAQNGSLKN